MDVVTSICDRVLVLSYGEIIAQRQAEDGDRRSARGRGLSRRARRRPACGSAPHRRAPCCRATVRPASWPTTPDGEPGHARGGARAQRAESGADVAFRERRPRHLAGDDLGRHARRGAGARGRRSKRSGSSAGQALTVRRRQPHAALLRDDRRERAARVSRRRSFRTCRRDELATYFAATARRASRIAEDQEQVDKLLELREPRRAARRRSSTTIRAACGTTRRRTCRRPTTRCCARARAARREPALAADLVGAPEPTTSRCCCTPPAPPAAPKGIPLRHRNVVRRRRAMRRPAAISASGEELLRLSADRLGRRLRFTLGRRAAAALRRSTSRSGRRRCCTTCARSRRPSISPRRAPGTHADARPGRHGGLHAAASGGCSTSSCRARSRSSAAAGRRAADARRTRRSMRARRLARLAAPIKDYLGLSRVRAARFTGGEAMGEDTFLFFRALGVNAEAVLRPDRDLRADAPRSPTAKCKLHTVGKPLPGVEVRIDDNGEILVRSGSVFDGYFDDAEATREGARRRLAAHRRCRLSRAGRPSRRARPRQRGRAHRGRRALHPELHREPHQVQRRTCATSPCSAPGATTSPPSSASTTRRSATGPRSAASPTPPTPTCRRSREVVRRWSPSRAARTSTRCCPSRCGCAASSTCTRISTPTTARSRAPASCAATSSRSAMQR